LGANGLVESESAGTGNSFFDRGIYGLFSCRVPPHSEEALDGSITNVALEMQNRPAIYRGVAVR